MKKATKKLSLKKEKIATLNNKEMSQVLGGATTIKTVDILGGKPHVVAFTGQKTLTGQ